MIHKKDYLALRHDLRLSNERNYRLCQLLSKVTESRDKWHERYKALYRQYKDEHKRMGC